MSTVRESFAAKSPRIVELLDELGKELSAAGYSATLYLQGLPPVEMEQWGADKRLIHGASSLLNGSELSLRLQMKMQALEVTLLAHRKPTPEDVLAIFGVE